MKVKISRGEKIFRVFNYIFLTLVVLICLYPMWHVMMGSVSDGSRLISHRGVLLALWASAGMPISECSITPISFPAI